MAFSWVLLKFLTCAWACLPCWMGYSLSCSILPCSSRVGVSVLPHSSPHCLHLSLASGLLPVHLPKKSHFPGTAHQPPALLALRSKLLFFLVIEKGDFFPPVSPVSLSFALVHFINSELNTCCMLNIPAERDPVLALEELEV